MPDNKILLDCYHVILAHYRAVKMECSRQSYKHEAESRECKKLRSLMAVNDSLIESCELEVKKLETQP